MSAPQDHGQPSQAQAVTSCEVRTAADLEHVPNHGYDLKVPFASKATLESLAEKYPTPFHLYDETGIRRNMEAIREAFSWNPGFREYFAVKANPNPALISILREYGCGCDCSSYTELMIAEAVGITGQQIMFSSNDTPAADFAKARELGAIVNFDDISHIEFFERVAGPIPETVSCRFNPGGLFQLANGIMDNPGDAKYGMTTEQLFEAFSQLKAKGAKNFGIHAFLASNTVTNDYYPKLARILFKLAVELEEKTGAHVAFVNLSGGVGVPYLPGQTANDIRAIGEGVRAAYEEILVPAGMGDVAIFTEMGSDFTYEKQVEAFGETLDISIRRYADTTLQQAKDESGRAYYDNKVQLVIKRNDGSVFVDRTFAKTDFSEFTNNDYGRHGALLGFMFDTVENGRMKFGASVGSPDPTSDEFIPIEVLIDRQGKISFQNATSLDSGNGEEKSKAQSELEAAEAEGM